MSLSVKPDDPPTLMMGTHRREPHRDRTKNLRRLRLLSKQVDGTERSDAEKQRPEPEW